MKKFVLVALFVAACGKGKSGPELTPAAFGSRPVPPGRLAKVKPRMTQAEVKALFPDNRPTPNHSGSPSLTIDSDFGNADYRIGFYSDIDAVSSVEVEVPGDMKITEALKQAWGKPIDELGGMPRWENAEDGYEASVWDKHRSSSVRFEPFVALAPAFFGAAPAPIAQLAKVSFGMTWDQVKAAAPGLEGPKGGTGSYQPFEPGPKGVQLDVTFIEDKVYQMNMRMPVRGAALLVKAWGPGRVGKERGGTGEVHCWETADKAMAIEMLSPAADAMAANVVFLRPDQGSCAP